ncbi:copper chaperone PCu(A)C [Salinisphaera sp. SPP-AMP-43]|uniref:copper chaperone PCu(A)C n=1 Tax=Salinisphaera sp. SPP-AMP-43 TaxID=3121288 RepID=UPI003C6E8A05
MLVLSLTGCGQSDPAADCGGLQIDDAWVAPAHTGSREMLGYFTLRNTGSQPVRVGSVASDAFDRAVFQDKAAAAKSSDDAQGGAQPLAPFTVAAGQAMVFEPGQREVALYSPSRSYQDGDAIQLRLVCGADSQATLTGRATVRDRHNDLPAPADEQDEADRKQVLEDGRDGGGPGASDDSKTAN